MSLDKQPQQRRGVRIQTAQGNELGNGKGAVRLIMPHAARIGATWVQHTEPRSPATTFALSPMPQNTTDGNALVALRCTYGVTSTCGATSRAVRCGWRSPTGAVCVGGARVAPVCACSAASFAAGRGCGASQAGRGVQLIARIRGGCSRSKASALIEAL